MMPTAIDEVFQPLRNEVLDIHMAWRLYRETFATTEERVNLLNRYAEVWFGYAQAAMYDDLVVSLFRLLDPASSRGKGRENLTLARLANVVEAHGQTDLANVIRAAKNYVEILLQPFADWRHKQVAHNDLSRMQARWQGNPTSPGPSTQTVEEALAGVRECMNSVDQYYQNNSTAYKSIFILRGDGEDLIKHLEHYDKHLEEVRAGAPTPATSGCVALSTARCPDSHPGYVRPTTDQARRRNGERPTRKAMN